MKALFYLGLGAGSRVPQGPREWDWAALSVHEQTKQED